MKKAFSQALSQFASISIIEFIVLTVISMIICTVCYWQWSVRKERKMDIWEILPIYCLVIYVNVVLQLTFLGRTDGSRIGIRLHMSLRKGKTAFGMLANMYSFLNIMLFVPYGFLLNWIMKNRRNYKWINYGVAVLLSLAGSLLIELSQLVTGRGYYEVEDLVCNTLGGAIGTVLWIACALIYDRFIKTWKEKI